LRAALISFSLLFLGICSLHGLSLFLLEISFKESYFVEVYGAIFGFTFLFLWALLHAFNGLSHYVAWLYLLASGLKFGLFFLFLWPAFRADGAVSILEKTTFLIPYCSSLVLETRIVISKLNKI
jgi:hypothetical protein